MKNLLTGLLAGIAISYLTAPSRGKDTRKRLTDEFEKRTQGAKAQLEKAITQAQEMIGKANKQPEEKSNTVHPQAKTSDPKAT